MYFRYVKDAIVGEISFNEANERNVICTKDEASKT
jgi:hypothetical protein